MKTTNADWIDAIAKLRTLPRINDIAEDLEVNLDDLEKKLAKLKTATTAFDELFGGGDWTAQTPGQWLVGAMLAVRAKSFTKSNEMHEGDLELSEKRVVGGDFHITGNLELKSDLFVLGNLAIGGYTRDTYMDISHLVVAGSIKAGKGIFSEGFLGAGGRASAPIIALTFNQGFAKLLDGAAAQAIVECDHGGSRIFGAVDASVLIYDELHCDEEHDNSSVADLAQLLTPAAREAIEGQEAMDAVSTLAQKIAEGVEVLR